MWLRWSGLQFLSLLFLLLLISTSQRINKVTSQISLLNISCFQGVSTSLHIEAQNSYNIPHQTAPAQHIEQTP